MYYFVFDEQGVAVERLDRESERLQKCWALVDSNSKVTVPCEALLFGASRIIQTASPMDEGWKDWRRRQRASLFIMELPGTMEIMAIG